ncbi:hypothetical protein DFH28DRAFT_1137086 [Melampsora americana]|nr:hypothetical protein DFH28DRAFT_1137086 [Melampsora americana]
MSTSNIKSTAARLNAIESAMNREVNSEGNVNNNNSITPTRTNSRTETGPTGPTYNKQALISSYLGRGKETARQIGPSEGPNKQNDNSQSNSQGQKNQETSDSQVAKEKNKDPSGEKNVDQFCEFFGATTTLPKIKKINASEEMRKKKLKEIQKKLEEIRELEKQSQELVDLTAEEILPVEESSISVNLIPKFSFSEGGLNFDFSKTPDANSLGLPLFFHKNMQCLQGTLPLTIFNKNWQQAASDNHVNYKISDKEVEKYRGHPYPGEWSQSRFDWNENFDSFIETCRKIYKYLAFANALELHKKNVIRIFKEQRSWVIAFRYDLTIRKATFAIRNPDEKVPNPSLEPSGLVTEIYYSARAQNDLNIDENPYRTGGPKFGQNPYSDMAAEQTT